MLKRKIINIDTDKCNGCGLCIPNCPEGALRVVDGRLRLVSDLFCDGLGACIGHCPTGAIIIEERTAEPYDERRVMDNILKQGMNTVKAHLEHLSSHSQKEFFLQAIEYLKEKGIANPLEDIPALPCRQAGSHGHTRQDMPGCPGTAIIDFRNKEKE